MAYKKSSVCQIPGIGCFGCCGYDFTSKKPIKAALKKNTEEYKKYKDKIKFRDRSKKLRKCGICKNLILKRNKIYCSLHPEQNKDKDLRIGHCDVKFICKAARKYDKWPDDTRKKFLKFIKDKKIDWYDYSIKMDNNILLKEFEAKLKNERNK